MTLDSPTSIHRNDRAERAERGDSCSDSGGADLSRHVQKLFDDKGNQCRPSESASRYLPNFSNESGASCAPEQSRFGGVVDQLRQQRTHLLLDASAPPESRLAAVRELAHAGTGNVTVRGNDGQPYKLRLETEAAGSREMVHLYMTGADGKEHTVLRGVANQKGAFEREHDKCGNAVGWYGAGAAQLQSVSSSYREQRDYPHFRPQPNDEQFQPPRDGGADDFRLRPRPFDQAPEQNGRQWVERAAQDARNQTRQLVQTTAGVYLRSGMAVDADGSPRARQIDPDGQLNTSMRYTDNKSINAEVVPYMVLPGGAYQKFGVKLGDMVLVRNTDNGRMAVAVFADVGPRNKTGEGSMALAREMGLNPSPTKGGTSKSSIEYLVLPNSHDTKPRNEQELMARIAEQRRKFGIA